MKRLYLQIYLTVLAVLVLFAGAWSLLWMVAMGPHEERMFAGIARVAARALPPADAPREELGAALADIANGLLSDLAVYDPGGRLAAHVGEPLALDPERGPLEKDRHSYLFQIRLADGRWLVARHRYEHGLLEELALMLALLAGAVALGAWPLVRRLTGRLERLRSRIDALGEGDLSARVEVEGRDEVAELAARFNRAAERIEQLVEAQRMMLAGASHELRTPLARIRMAAELLAGDARPDLRARIERDVAELDEAIEELLLGSRLASAPGLERREPVDLLALLAEEGAGTAVEVGGAPLRVPGDPRLLRRLVRNLLQNALRHGGGAPVEARVDAGEGGRVRLRVDDAGPGVPESERERIFAPFYRPPGSRESGSGYGLGLALVRRIARLHGGEARCLARPGGGTRLEVELPGMA